MNLMGIHPVRVPGFRQMLGLPHQLLSTTEPGVLTAGLPPAVSELDSLSGVSLHMLAGVYIVN